MMAKNQLGTFELLTAPSFDPDWTFANIVQDADGTFTGSGEGTWIDADDASAGAYAYYGGTLENQCTVQDNGNVCFMINVWYAYA